MYDLVTLAEAADRLHLPAERVADRLHAAQLPAAGVADDGRRLLYSFPTVATLTRQETTR